VGASPRIEPAAGSACGADAADSAASIACPDAGVRIRADAGSRASGAHGVPYGRDE